MPALVKAKPELAKVAPFSTVLELLKGDRAAMAKLTEADLDQARSPPRSTGMSVETFQAEVKKWIAEAKDPRWKKPYTELTYLPMQEVLKYLRANGYKTYIVTGGGRTSCACTRRRPTASRPSRWSAPPAARSTATPRTASRS